MEAVEIRDVTPEQSGMSVQISAEDQLCAFSDRYQGRGIAQSVREEAERQIEKERQTTTLAPDAYRLSTLSEGAVNGCYRHGKENMAASDLLFYFSETRQKRIDSVDFSENDGTEEVLKAEQTSLCTRARDTRDTEMAPAERITSVIKSRGQSLRAALPTWFDRSAPDTSKEKKGFPLSAFASMIAIAVSLMLIVASSVLLMRAETRVSSLKEQILTANAEMSDLQADLEVRDDLLLIRRIAIEEYGMVGEEYVRMSYLSLQSKDMIEVYEQEREQALELSALLSAIGIK